MYVVFRVTGMNGTAAQGGCKDAVSDRVRCSGWSLPHTKCPDKCVLWLSSNFSLYPPNDCLNVSQLFCFSFTPAACSSGEAGEQDWILGCHFNRTVWCAGNRPIPQSVLSPLIDAPSPLVYPRTRVFSLVAHLAQKSGTTCYWYPIIRSKNIIIITLMNTHTHKQLRKMKFKIPSNQNIPVGCLTVQNKTNACCWLVWNTLILLSVYQWAKSGNKLLQNSVV